MREIVIVISDLYLAPGQTGDPTDAGGGAGAIGSLPGFEHAVRFGGRRSIEGEGGWRPWLARWLGRGDLAGVAPAVIAAAAVGETAGVSTMPTASDAEFKSEAPLGFGRAYHSSNESRATPELLGPTVWIATPVHLIAGLTSLHLDRRSILRLPPTDLEGFALDFNRTFGDTDLRLMPLANGDFLMHGPATLIGATTEPSRALVADLEASLPKGTDAKALKRLGAELEMWLHTHPLNEARRRRGELPVSTLWLWGGGSSLTQPNSPTAFPSMPSEVALGSDPYLIGLWHANGGRTRVLPDDQLASVLADTHAQRAVFVAEVTPMLHSNPRWTVFEALAELDRLYVSPAIAALRAGAVESVVLIANDTELRVGRHDRLKLWRRPRPAIAGLTA